MSTTTAKTISMDAFTAVTTAGAATVTVQGPQRTPFYVAVATSLPAANAAALFCGDNEGYLAAFSSLAASDIVYVKAADPARLSVTAVSA